MRQEVEDCHWNCSSDVENNYQPNRYVIFFLEFGNKIVDML